MTLLERLALTHVKVEAAKAKLNRDERLQGIPRALWIPYGVLRVAQAFIAALPALYRADAARRAQEKFEKRR